MNPTPLSYWGGARVRRDSPYEARLEHSLPWLLKGYVTAVK